MKTQEARWNPMKVLAPVNLDNLDREFHLLSFVRQFLELHRKLIYLETSFLTIRSIFDLLNYSLNSTFC